MKNKKNSFLLLFLIIFMMGGILITTEDVKACSCAKGSFCLAGGCMTDWATTGSACSQNLLQHVCSIDSVSLGSHSVCLIAPTGATTCKAGSSCTADGHKYCTEDKCGIYVEGADEFHTAKDWSADGDTCKVTEDTFLSCSTPAVGKWDYKEGKCVNCQAGTNKEINVCGDLTGTYFNGTNCTKAGNNKFESACGADTACDEVGSSGDACVVGSSCESRGDSCVAGDTCNASGECAVTGLSLSASASPTTTTTGGSSTITFKVTDTAGDVSGALVDSISLTVGTGGITGNTVGCTSDYCCTTNASGECAVTYNAPAAATVATIEAKKATKTGSTDSGLANTNVTVNSCLGSTFINFVSDPYDVGETITFRGRDNANSFAICLYNPSGSRKADNELNPASGSNEEITYVADATGIWTGTIELGATPTCPATLAGASDCFDTATVNAVGPGPGPPSCTNNLGCITGITAADITAGCRCGTIFASAATNSVGDHCCAKEPDPATGAFGVFYGTKAECDASSCGGAAAVCNDNNTKEGGEQCDGTDLGLEDCVSLGFTGGTLSCPPGCVFDTSLCTGAGPAVPTCDPDDWFFCNPLRGTVETLVQAGETMLGYILGLIGSIALLFIIIAGMMYMTSAGNEERISSSKKILTGAVIGLMIALLAYGMLHVIMTVLDM